MKHYLGVKAVEDDAHIWNTSSGRWIHDWLKQLASGGEKTLAVYRMRTRSISA